MWGSTVPGALLALIELFKTAPGLEGVRVYDGPDLDGAQPDEAISVGYLGEEDSLAVEAQTEHEGLTVDRSREQYTVHCLIEARNGSGEVPAARKRVFELYAAVGAALAAFPRLDGTPMSVQPGAWTYSQEQDGAGLLAKITLGIDVDAYTRR